MIEDGRRETADGRRFKNTILEPMLIEAGIQLVRPLQYMDKWRLSARGIAAVPNTAVQDVLGFKTP